MCIVLCSHLFLSPVHLFLAELAFFSTKFVNSSSKSVLLIATCSISSKSSTSIPRLFHIVPIISCVIAALLWAAVIASLTTIIFHQPSKFVPSVAPVTTYCPFLTGISMVL
mmetsp:Transcript_37131/g.86599  ORF Transcript_37131/g.86599 Transcript_37131/m.86599 type:complete len:111 (-) Transcript_37131:2280-2612(-)